MKQVILLIMFLTAGIFAQGGSTRTVPQYHHWQRIYDGVLGDGGDGLDTTDAFSPLMWAGVITVVMESDTLDSLRSDSCLTVYMQVKRKYTYPENQVVDQDWTGYYDDTDITKTKIDTVARSYVNTPNVFRMNPAVILSSTGQWTWGDSVRFILQIGVGDSLEFVLDVGGQ